MSKIQAVRNRVQAMPTGVKQFLKFATVGAMNTAIDWSLGFFLLFYTGIPHALGTPLARVLQIPASWFGHSVRPEAATVWVAKILSSGTATINSFIWNRRWTFRIRDKHARARQFAKFVTVNVIGMTLNATITTLLVRPFLPNPPKLVFMLAQATATGIVLFWNFFANKYWTFREAPQVKSSDTPTLEGCYAGSTADRD
ncbi:MAG: GtrA family protein [Armatimonadetes bacterium]|nr:GtrA family protein [Armatimonadota bacterium]CUU33960.1 Putative flippase GtrA (transmembrane translocase of bactoprenol-linked glucose) [Armatimonadetes bacterium DC]